MKIITQGKPPEAELYRCTCTRCKCIFEFERGEAKYVADQREGDFLQIPCPTCGHPCTRDVRR